MASYRITWYRQPPIQSPIMSHSSSRYLETTSSSLPLIGIKYNWVEKCSKKRLNLSSVFYIRKRLNLSSVRDIRKRLNLSSVRDIRKRLNLSSVSDIINRGNLLVLFSCIVISSDHYVDMMNTYI